MPALVQGWYKSPGPWRQDIYHSPRQKQANDFTGFIQNRRRESFLYRPDETHQHGRQGRCSHQHTEITELSLPPCCHSSSWSRKKLPFSVLPEAEHTLPPHHSRSMKWQTCSPPMQKRTQQSRDPLCRLAEGWNSSSSSSVVFVLLGTASNSPTIAKVEQRRAGKRHRLPVSSPICALEHLPKTFLI